MATELEIERISWRKPTAPPQNKNTPTRFTNVKQKATGIPVSNRTRKPPKMAKSGIHHSNDIYLHKAKFMSLRYDLFSLLWRCSPAFQVSIGPSQELNKEQEAARRDDG